jgi:ectoine hydroxylase-related dioxygenase (phytanoyl-CoA dioxygenase family)
MTTHIPRYGEVSPGDSTGDLACEELHRLGYTILPHVLGAGQVEACRDAIDELLRVRRTHIDEADLASIGELDIVRAPLVDDELFLFSVAMAPEIRDLASRLIGHYHLLHLQNAIINGSDRVHHQSAWHRDLPYLDRTSSAPLAMSALFCIDEFSTETGATLCIPGSHLVAEPPSDAFVAKHAVAIEATAGDVIVFDSMLLHRAGVNSSSKPRRGVNNVYSVGIIRQQIDLPRALDGRYSDDPELAVLLGYASNAPASAEAYQLQRLHRRGTT